MIYIDEQHAINFRHSIVDSIKSRPHEGFSLLSSRRTECEILQFTPEKEPVVLGYGESLCHPFDNFNKEFGRKNALTRAIKHLDRDTRRQIWQAYFNR